MKKFNELDRFVLEYLNDHPESFACEIATGLSWSNGSTKKVKHVIVKYQKKGLVTNGERAYILTPKGKELLQYDAKS